MKKIKSFSSFQRFMFILMIVLPVVFAGIYYVTISKVGIEYQDEILVVHKVDGKTVYTGKIDGEIAEFTVDESQNVEFTYGDKNYGRYTMILDPEAVPDDEKGGEMMTGVVIYHNDAEMFRGGALDIGDDYWLFSKEDPSNLVSVTYVNEYGVEVDRHGIPVDQMKPTASIIYELLSVPKLTHKGEALAWFAGTFFCIVNIISILFSEELFRWSLSFQIKDAEKAEASEWEYSRRGIEWVFLTVMVIIIFMTGLR